MFKKVYAFEPNPVAYEVLKINSNFISETKNIEPFNFGLSDINGTLPFLINHSNIGGSAIADNDETSENIIDVSVKKLDDLTILNDENIALIKIDVDGHELDVLKSGKKTIMKHKPFIYFEFAPYLYREFGYSSEILIKFVKNDLNYIFYDEKLTKVSNISDFVKKLHNRSQNFFLLHKDMRVK